MPAVITVRGPAHVLSDLVQLTRMEQAVSRCFPGCTVEATYEPEDGELTAMSPAPTAPEVAEVAAVADPDPADELALDVGVAIDLEPEAGDPEARVLACPVCETPDILTPAERDQGLVCAECTQGGLV